jgi:hypothetical protein
MVAHAAAPFRARVCKDRGVPGQWPTHAKACPMTIQRMTDLDLAGKRVLIRQGGAA